MLHHTMNHTMKDSITIPLTLIRHYLTEGQLAVLISNNKRQLKGKVVFVLDFIDVNIYIDTNILRSDVYRIPLCRIH